MKQTTYLVTLDRVLFYSALTRCFAWDTDSLDDRPAGEKLTVEIKLLGMKTSPVQTQPTKGKKPKKTRKTSPAQTQTQTETAPAPDKKTTPELCDISEKINAGLEKMTVDSDDNGKRTPSLPNESKSEKTSRDDSGAKKPTLSAERGKPGRKRIVPSAVVEGKKTRQTQLNFAGVKKVSPAVAEPRKVPEPEPETDGGATGRSVSEMDVTVSDVGEAEVSKPERGEVRSQGRSQTDLMDVGDEMCSAQVLNESTPQVNALTNFLSFLFFSLPLSVFLFFLSLSLFFFFF